MIALQHQFLGNQIDDRETVTDDRIELFLQSFFDQLRELFSVEPFGFIIGEPCDFLIRPIHVRRVQLIFDWNYFIDAVGNFLGISYNNFLSFLFAKEGETIQHLVCRPEMGFRQMQDFSLIHLQRPNQYFPVDGVFLVQVMHIPGCDDRLAQFFADGNDLGNDLFQITFIFHQFSRDERRIDLFWHNFDVIIELGFRFSSLCPFLHHRLKYFAFAAGGANQ